MHSTRSEEIIIKPRKVFSVEDLREVWRFRELLYFFVWRALKVRYKQAVIGVSWILFQPLISMIVFTVFFGKFAQIPSEGIPYPVFVFSGLLIWQFFSSTLSEISGVFVDNQGIVTKIYFPRIILPVSVVLTKLVDFFVASMILVALMIYYAYIPGAFIIVLLPFLLFITSVSAFGIGLLLASINVKYRDVRHVVPFFIQLWLFVTPVIYPTAITGKYAKFLAFNPMTGVIEGVRAALFSTGPTPWSLIAGSIAVAVFFLLVGTLYFRKTEAWFADII